MTAAHELGVEPRDAMVLEDAVADGIAGDIGTGTTDEQAQALAAATSGAIQVLPHHSPATVPSGLWCYRVDRDRSLPGGAVNDVGRVVSG